MGMIRRWFGAYPAYTRTLQLRRPFGHALMLATAFLSIYFAAGELLVRFTAPRVLLGVPSVGSKHKQFEQQWFRLREHVAERGMVECIIVGDSTVMTDFSPVAFTESFRAETGQSIDCFNFGVGALSMVGAATLTQILVQEYAPRVLMVGVEALNFTVPRDGQGDADLGRTAWARYKLGRFSPIGWLFEHAHLPRHMGNLSRLLTFSGNHNQVMQSAAGEIGGVEDGYFPFKGTAVFDVSQPPDPALDHPYIEHYFAALENYRPLPENVEALATILALDGPVTQIAIVEMPVPTTFHTFFDRDMLDYAAFVAMLAATTSDYGVPLLRMQNPDSLQHSVWYNYNHLNADGARRFSDWLAQQLAHAPEASLLTQP